MSTSLSQIRVVEIESQTRVVEIESDDTLVVRVGQQGPAGATGIAVWTTNIRPISPTHSNIGYNTDFNGLEIYSDDGWLVLNGVWTFGNRPSTTGLARGSKGYNTELGTAEEWNGEEWKPQ